MVKVSQAIKQVNDKLNLNDIILHEESILKLYRETMLKIYDFGFEVSFYIFFCNIVVITLFHWSLVEEL